ncbi:MAG: hypothetical protein JW891_02755, partial [Candidatus Lokiarchaeota archaeon]|nr:hypothetical protein [Candidatus Lokiarchaeota archaeon]
MKEWNGSLNLIEQYLDDLLKYEEHNDYIIDKELYRTTRIMDLMKELKNNPGKQEIIKNSILTLNALIDENLPIDIYHTQGKDME